MALIGGSPILFCRFGLVTSDAASIFIGAPEFPLSFRIAGGGSLLKFGGIA
jgi:hypothetical protein